jgi:hypothetical protein
MVEKFISAMTKSPATIATEINGTYVKNESTSVYIAWNKLYCFFAHSQYLEQEGADFNATRSKIGLPTISGFQPHESILTRSNNKGAESLSSIFRSMEIVYIFCSIQTIPPSNNICCMNSGTFLA